MIKRFVTTILKAMPLTLPTIAAILSCVAIGYAATSLVHYQPGFRTVNGSQLNLMVDIVNRLQGIGATPTLSSCGTSPTITGSPTAGTVTMGSASPTACTITFPTNFYGATPFCTVAWASTISWSSYTVTSSAITLSQSPGLSSSVNYYCLAP